MNPRAILKRGGLGSLLVLAGVLWATLAPAFPPAPHHTYYGMVRNQWGEPLNVANATVTLQTTNGAMVQATITTSSLPGVNYLLQVPMDAGTTPDAYTAAALKAGQSFQLRVRIGTVTYVPLELALQSPSVGLPGEYTRLDLTLGEDTDGDGLPDAWEQAIIDVLGGTLASITPNGDSDGDGIRNRDEYLAGTYAFDAGDGFTLSLAGVASGNASLEFLALRGRTYRIEASTDLRQWTPVSFRLPGVSTPQESYQSLDVRLLRVDVPVSPGTEAYRYFKAVVN